MNLVLQSRDLANLNLSNCELQKDFCSLSKENIYLRRFPYICTEYMFLVVYKGYHVFYLYPFTCTYLFRSVQRVESVHF
jgi:hypothetical protein